MDPTAPETGCMAAERGWHGQALDTARLRLRPMTPADAEAVALLAGDWEVARFTRIPHPLTVEAARAHMLEKIALMRQGRGALLALERRVDGAPIGACGFSIKDGAAHLGYWVARAHWGQGYAPEALRRLSRLIFRNLGLAEAVADVMPENQASIRVLGKLGFGEACGLAVCESRGVVHQASRFILPRERWEAGQNDKPLLLVAAVALVDTDGRVLLARRPEGRMMAGLWEFPGGKVDAGETPEAALVREMEEELGIDIGASCLAPLAFSSHDYDTFHLLMPLYVCRTWTGQVAAREGQGLAWARPVRLADYPMPPADLPLVPLLRDWL